jgi:putative transposase
MEFAPAHLGVWLERSAQYIIRDRDAVYGDVFIRRLRAMSIRDRPTAPRSPWQNAYADRWVRSVKEECLSKVILFGERPLRRALSEYVGHYHAERNHQGKDNVLLFPRYTCRRRAGPVQCRERLGGLLRY